MKPLTIEDKAEAYDYAVNKAKELILNENGFIRVDKLLFNELFPSESEDERIRKGLIGYFSDFRLGTFAGIDPKKIITWLEKQGDKKDNLSVDFVLGYLGIKPAYKDGNAWCILLDDNIQEGICGFGDTKEEALIAFMKELIEKQDWKPSEEQMKALDIAIRAGIQLGSWEEEALRELQKQLYLLMSTKR